MNELITKEELKTAVAVVEERRRELKTAKGQKLADDGMLAILGVFTTFGYKLPEGQNVKQMATVWRFALNEYIGTYGMELIKRAAVEFVRNDSREYHPFPVPGDLIKEIKKIGVNPIAELKRRELEQEIKKADREKAKEASAWAKAHLINKTMSYKDLMEKLGGGNDI